MEKRNMINKIIDAYENLRDQLPGMGYGNTVRVIVKMKKESFDTFLAENNDPCRAVGLYWLDEYPDVAIVRLFGVQTPIIVVDGIPEDVDFVMQLKEDYVREARIELYNKLFKMFGGETL